MTKVYLKKSFLHSAERQIYQSTGLYYYMQLNVINNVIRSYFLSGHDSQTKKYKNMANF